jgi:hypothetical protein
VGLGVEVVEEVFQFRICVAPGCIPTGLDVTKTFSFMKLLLKSKY